MTEIAFRRLSAQRLSGEPWPSAVEAVRSLGAVQAQDYGGAKWGLGLRTRGATEALLDRLFEEGAILRTHVLRPTWHFVLPEDIRWLLELTGPHVRAGLTWRHRQLELDQHVIERAGQAFAAALAGGRHLTRPELGEVLREAGIPPDGQRLPHLLLTAELDGIIVSGPRRGKLFTWGLLAERAPRARALERDEALAELTRRYFRSRGPAQLPDFAWWSGLPLAEARRGLGLAGPALERLVREGKEHWFAGEAGPPGGPAAGASSLAHLLPNFDEYLVAYRDRSAAIHDDRPFDPTIFSFGSVLSNVVTVGGRVRGSWRRSDARTGVHVEVKLLDGLEPAEAAAVEEAGRRLARYLERPVEITSA